MPPFKAFIFDLNGTIINDMAYHEQVWLEMVNALGAKYTAEQIKKQMYGKNSELLKRVFGEQAFSDTEIAALEMKKEQIYQQRYAAHMKAINGFEVFMKAAYKQQIKMAIGSAAIPFNIHFIINGLQIQAYFSAIVSANDVAISKPHPETFLKAASLLEVAAKDCIVFEDAPKGVEAAANANMPCIVILSTHTEEEFAAYDNILFFVKDYANKQLLSLLQ